MVVIKIATTNSKKKKQNRTSPDVQFKQFLVIEQELDLEQPKNESEKSVRKKNSIQKDEKN